MGTAILLVGACAGVIGLLYARLSVSDRVRRRIGVTVVALLLVGLAGVAAFLVEVDDPPQYFEAARVPRPPGAGNRRARLRGGVPAGGTSRRSRRPT